jgi:hypothetical protein
MCSSSTYVYLQFLFCLPLQQLCLKSKQNIVYSRICLYKLNFESKLLLFLDNIEHNNVNLNNNKKKTIIINFNDLF